MQSSGRTPESGRISTDFISRIKQASDLIFEGIAVNNAQGFDIAELNLTENIKHSFSDREDNLSLSSGEMSLYKQLLIDIYNNREQLDPFLSSDESFIDPLRVILSYLAQDELENYSVEISDEMISVNVPLKNKFYDVLNPKLDTSLLRRCSISNIILPQYLLQESDRVRIV
jgi:hypothetical protein